MPSYKRVQRLAAFIALKSLMRNQSAEYLPHLDEESGEELPLTSHGGDALCPKCGIDSIIPDATLTLLKEMHQIYFVTRDPL